MRANSWALRGDRAPFLAFFIATACTFSFSSQGRAADEASPIAQKGDAPAPREVAKERYRAGVKEFQAGRYKDAVDLFLEADQLAPSAALSFNIARAYEKLGDRAATLAWYRDYLRRAPDADDADQVRSQVDELEAGLARKGVQQVSLLSEPHGATVVIDNRPVGVTPWTGELAPGKHTVELRLRGYADVQQTFTLPPDDAVDVEIRLVPARAVPETPAPGAPETTEPSPAPTQADRTPPPEQESPALGIVGWSVLGLGVASIGGAVTFEILRSGAEDDARGASTQIGFADAVDSMESHQTLARVFGGVGAILVLGGGAILAIDAGLFDAEQGPTEAKLGVGCLPGGCMASARGRF